MAERPMLIFVSDLHLTDALHGGSVPKEALFERFWTRIQAARGKRPAQLCFVGDLFDIVRSPAWLDGAVRPYHTPDKRVADVVDGIVGRILEREANFFTAIRTVVEAGALEIVYLIGNHDRLLAHAPRSRRMIWKALTGRDEDITFESERAFPDHEVLAYHGHVGDPINVNEDGGGTIGDAIGLELITRFPRMVKRLLDGQGIQYSGLLDDIDDVRPIYAVPAWVRNLGFVDRSLLRPVGQTWKALVEDFLSKPFVRGWMRERRLTERTKLGFDSGKKLRLLLELSTKRVVARGSDEKLTKIYRMFQHGFDGKMAGLGAEEITRRKGMRFVVNGHSHFSSMVPLGTDASGKSAAYFNTGTWRTVHQIGNVLPGRPTFLPYDAMSYLVFFPTGDPLGRDYEWWTGAMVPR